MSTLEFILSAVTTLLTAGWISTIIEARRYKQRDAADTDNARIANLQAVCDKQAQEIERLEAAGAKRDQAYQELLEKYYEVLREQSALVERITKLENKLAQYEN